MIQKFLTAGTALCDRLPVSKTTKRVLLAASTLLPAATLAGISHLAFDVPYAQIGSHIVSSLALYAPLSYAAAKGVPFKASDEERTITTRNNALLISSSFWVLAGLYAGQAYHIGALFMSVPTKHLSHLLAFKASALILGTGALSLYHARNAIKPWGDATKPFDQPTPPPNPIAIPKNNKPTL